MERVFLDAIIDCSSSVAYFLCTAAEIVTYSSRRLLEVIVFSIDVAILQR